MELKITKEKVLEAASKCNQAEEILKVLFPEAFKNNGIIIPNFKSITDSQGYRMIENKLEDNSMFWLGDAFTWVIKDSAHGGYLLIPKRKDNG